MKHVDAEGRGWCEALRVTSRCLPSVPRSSGKRGPHAQGVLDKCLKVGIVEEPDGAIRRYTLHKPSKRRATNSSTPYACGRMEGVAP